MKPQIAIALAVAVAYVAYQHASAVAPIRSIRGAREAVELGRVSPAPPIPEHISKPAWYYGHAPPSRSRVEVHDSEGIRRMRAAGHLASRLLALAEEMVAPGVTTDAISAAVHQHAVAAGAYPSPLRYKGFPQSICTSVNEVVCHGIPDDRPLRDGDIVNVDLTVMVDNVHADTSATFAVGAPLSDVGKAVAAVAKRHGMGVVTRFVGHGIGSDFHSPPLVYHHEQSWLERVLLGTNQLLIAGQTLTIEPILVQRGGSTRSVTSRRDGWTTTTVDGGLAAQFEHTVLVVPGGVDVLTMQKPGRTISIT